MGSVSTVSPRDRGAAQSHQHYFNGKRVITADTARSGLAGTSALLRRSEWARKRTTISASHSVQPDLRLRNGSALVWHSGKRERSSKI
ncbi:MAG: hypothetical protein M0Z61_09220 [Nitrospiraceae bacterium]|nr:hypothetical protein [Nitrospiraceae bacterium]